MKAPTIPGLVTCVVDGNRLLHEQVLRWFAALHLIARVRPSDLVVVAIGSVRSSTLEYLGSVGVGITDAIAFDERSRHCNKIGGMRTVGQLTSGTAVLSDCDVAFVSDPRGCEVPPGAIAAKHVDTANPPLHVLHAVLAAAGLALPPERPLELFPGMRTLWGNANGGLYIGRGPVLTALSAAWEQWAGWLLQRSHLLERWAVHVDQVAMMLSLTDSGTPFHPLDISWNCPTHLKCVLPVQNVRAVHYHRAVDPEGHLACTGNAVVDAAIRAINAAFDEVRKDAGVLQG